MIKINNLSFSYSLKTPFEKKALNNLTFNIDEGDFFGIIGHTGSGKSTLIQHFNALIKKQSGELVVEDIDLNKRFDYKLLRSRVGMVFQYPEYQLFDETVLKDVCFGAKNLGLSEEEALIRAREAIELVGLDFESIKERSPFEISGGERRRVAIAGVIAMRPKILVLDEPTAGLDPFGKSEILKLIHSIKGASSVHTVIMISHNMDEVAQNCNKIAVLNNGALEMLLSPVELFSHSEKLTALGLGVPKVTEAAIKLNECGLNVPRNIISEQALIDCLLKIFEKNNENDGEEGQ